MPAKVNAAPALRGRQVGRGSGVYLTSEPSDNAPRRAMIGGRQVSRFMDSIYLDRPCEKLGWKKIQVLNQVRRPLLERDAVSTVNLRLRTAFARTVNKAGADDVLEWGCGYHPMRELLNAKRYTGIDIDPSVISHNRGRMPADRWHPANGDLTDVDDASQDFILSAFVFHFRLTRTHIATMRRTVKPTGIVLANVYRRSAVSRRELAKNFEALGFRVHRERDAAELLHDHEFWCLVRDDHPDPEAPTRTLSRVAAELAGS